ncbi:MAG: LamG domain-containing protein, partial [Bacteroidota bacterium]
MKKYTNALRWTYVFLLWMSMTQLWAQPTSYDGPDDVVLIEHGGQTVALICSHDANGAYTFSHAGGDASGTTFHLGDFTDAEVDGTTIDQAYFFAHNLHHQGTTPLSLMGSTPDYALSFGAYDPARSAGVLSASDGEYNSQIDLSWSSVAGAEGYLLFREDLEGSTPLAVLEGEQHTNFTDIGLDIAQSYTYYVAPYSLANGDIFMGSSVQATGSTMPFGFSVAASSEADITFAYEFDNHLLIDLIQQAAYVEINDLTTGTLMYGDELALTDIADRALLFDNSLQFSGSTTNNISAGVYAQPNLGALSSWTTEMWVNAEQGPNLAYLFDDSQNRMFLDRLDRLVVYLGNTGFWSPAGTFTWDNWSHVAVTYDGTLSVYLDGQLVPMSTSPSSSAFEDQHTVSSAGLRASLQIGEPMDGRTNGDNLNGQVGMIRIWEVARTADQVAADFDDIFTTTAPGLRAQWTFDEETINLTSDVSSAVLSIASDDANAHPISWTPSYAFVSGSETKEVTTWLQEPVADGTSRDYEVSIYEVGTGRVLSQNTVTHTFSHPGLPQVTAVGHSSDPYRVSVSVTPMSTKADEYLIQRIDASGNRVSLGRVAYSGPGVAMEREDTYAYGTNGNVAGGTSYTYSAIPIYNNLERSFADEAHAGVSNAMTTLDYQVTATADADQTGVDITWDVAALTTAAYDTVRIERNGEVLILLPNTVGSYTDTLLLYGEDYNYTVVAIKNGQEAFAQETVASLDANGTVSGYLISANGDYALPNQEVVILNTGTGSAVDSVSTNTSGALQVTNLYYDLSTDFEWASLSGADMTNTEFTLARNGWEAELGFVTYDTTLNAVEETGLLTDATRRVLDDFNRALLNHVSFDLAYSPAESGAHLLFNVYRDGELIDIVTNITRYEDWNATKGYHTYTFMAYYYSSDLSEVRHESTTLEEVYYSGPTRHNRYELFAGSNVQVKWVIEKEALAQYYTIVRTDVATGDSVNVLTVPHNTTSDLYYAYDNTGEPNTAYTYSLWVTALSGEERFLDQDLITYPGLVLGAVSLTAQGTSSGTTLDVELPWFYNQEAKNVHGFVVIKENGDQVVKTLNAPYTNENGNSVTYSILDPAPATASGTLGVVFYKHTFDSLYFFDTLWASYTGATLPTPAALTVPGVPTLATNDSDQLQTPTLTVSKDAESKVFVAWDYPHYADVTFTLAYRAAGTTAWTETTLPNEQRTWLHENPVAQVMEYKLCATYADGRKSAETWDYGVARRYQRIQGYVYGSEDTPQPYVYVGVAGHWVQTDSTGYYRIEDLELPTGATALQYVAPGEAQVTLANALNITADQSVYGYNLVRSGSDQLYPTNDNIATVVDAQGFADPVHLTNEVRWSLDNNRYAGVKVYQGSAENEVADLPHGSVMVYVDSLASNNAASAVYYVRPYVTNAMGETQFTDTDAALVSGVDYPVLEAPAYAGALSNTAEGYVELNWAPVRQNVEGFVITRNDEPLATVTVEEAYHFIDTTGRPQQVYRYDVYGYIVTEGRVIISTNAATIDAVYPAPGIPTQVATQVATIGSTSDMDNGIEITWAYPATSSTLQGAVIYRDIDSVGSVQYPETMWVDLHGVPETHTTYTVRTYSTVEGQLYQSAGDTATIVFPEIQDPAVDPVQIVNFDTVRFDWSYPASGVEAFELVILRQDAVPTPDTVVHEWIASETAANSYYYTEGVADAQYKFMVRATSLRNGQTYTSAWVEELHTYQSLPAPVFYPGERPEGLVDTDFWYLYWRMSTDRFDGYRLSILDKDGNPYTGINPIDGEPITYENIEIPKNQEEFIFIPPFDDYYNGGTVDIDAVLTAHQDERGGGSSQVVAYNNRQLDPQERSSFAENFQATANGATSVFLSWVPPTDPEAARYELLRDGKEIAILPIEETYFEDINAQPGVVHLYQLITVTLNQNNIEKRYYRSTQGGTVGDGLVTAQIYSSSGSPIAGDSLMIQALVNDIGYEAVAYSDAEGKVRFRDLPYTHEGVVYTVSPAADHVYFDKQAVEILLDKSIKQGTAGIFINNRARLIEGTITNAYCDCGRDSVEVTLFSFDANDVATASSNEWVKTDHEGRFSFVLPYFIEEDVAGYELRVGNQRLNGTGEPMEEFGYYYQDGPFIEIDETDSTLTYRLSKAQLMAQEVTRVEITETINHPLSVEIAGPGDCDVFAGYEFTVRLRDTDGNVDLRVETVNRQLNLDLPPLDYTVSVIDVSKSDAFSQAVLDYFRSRNLFIPNKENYANYLETQDDAYMATQFLRYNERANLSIAGIDAIEHREQGCEPLYLMADDEANEAGVPHQVTLALTPEQVINGVACRVTSGYILSKFPGGTLQVSGATEDTLRYDEAAGAWETIEVTATTPNLVTPYTQLLEFYYYDANDNYQGSISQEIMIIGKQQLDGSDVFVLLEQETSVPVYVLRDPPGDQSSSYIKEKSNLFINLESGFNANVGVSLEREFKLKILGVEAGSKIKGIVGGSGVSNNGQVYALEFTNGLSTLGGAAASDNLQGALDGRDADVVVGLDVVLAYGMTEVLSFESCQPSKTRVLSVEPTEISTMWAYTRSQINTTIDYYKALTDDDGNYEFDEDSGDIISKLETSYAQFETILEELDTKYTPVCEMCQYAYTQDDDFLYSNHGEITEYLEDIQTFCANNSLYSNDGCSTTPLEEILPEWDDDLRDEYKEAYRKYLLLMEVENFYATYGADLHTNSNPLEDGTFIDALGSFDPLENITFSAGASVSRSTSTNSSESSVNATSRYLNMEFSLSKSVKYKMDFHTWFG